MTVMFRYPFVLWGAVIAGVFYLIFRLLKKRSTIIFPYTSFILSQKLPAVNRTEHVSPVCRMLALTCLFIALAQPLGSEREVDYEAQGIDIIMAIDVSGSMLAEDFQPDNRLKVAKEEAKRFIDNRTSDRVGLVVFAAQSFTQCPLTVDYDIVRSLIDRIQTGIIKDGTAIGLALGNAVNRLRQSEAASKVIILLTDGENNAGQIDPFTAAEMAKTMGIKVYTIAVGRGGLVPYPMADPVFGKVYRNIKLDVDEETLKEIARITDGLYFRARDRKGLREIYTTIDELEKSEIKITEYINYEQLFQYPLILALVCLLVEIGVRFVMRATIP